MELTANHDEKKKIKSLASFFEVVGTGRTQYITWFLGFLVGYADYTELLFISVVIPYLRCHWNLSETFEASISFCVFGSYAICSLLLGNISDKYGRKKIMIINTLILLLASVSTVIFDNKWVFLLCRVLTGGSVGANRSIITPYTVELTPDKVRSRGPIFISLGSNIALLSVNLQGLLFLNLVGWRWYIVVLILPRFLVLALLFYVTESPRFLLVSQKMDKLRSCLQTIMTRNKIPTEEFEISMESIDSNTRLGSISDALSPMYRRSVLSLACYYFANTEVDFGLVMFLPLMFTSNFCGTGDAAPTHSCETLQASDFSKLMLSNGMDMLALLTAFILMRTGRLWILRVGAFGICVAIIGFYFCVNETFTLAAALIAKYLQTTANSVLWVTTSEILPTTIRSTATGLINCSGKIGGMIGAGSVYLLFYESPKGLVSLFLGIQIIGFISSIVFNVETKRMVTVDVAKRDP